MSVGRALQHSKTHSSKSHRRDQLGIIANIIDSMRGQGLLKTQIMYRANLSFWQLSEYLAFLLDTGLITQTPVDGKVIYSVTAKGQGFLRKHQELKKMLATSERLSSIAAA
jgi:predicted transcriptional regulator